MKFGTITQPISKLMFRFAKEVSLQNDIGEFEISSQTRLEKVRLNKSYIVQFFRERSRFLGPHILIHDLLRRKFGKIIFFGKSNKIIFPNFFVGTWFKNIL